MTYFVTMLFAAAGTSGFILIADRALDAGSLCDLHRHRLRWVRDAPDPASGRITGRVTVAQIAASPCRSNCWAMPPGPVFGAIMYDLTGSYTIPMLAYIFAGLLGAAAVFLAHKPKHRPDLTPAPANPCGRIAPSRLPKSGGVPCWTCRARTSYPPASHVRHSSY